MKGQPKEATLQSAKKIHKSFVKNFKRIPAEPVADSEDDNDNRFGGGAQKKAIQTRTGRFGEGKEKPRTRAARKKRGEKIKRS